MKSYEVRTVKGATVKIEAERIIETDGCIALQNLNPGSTSHWHNVALFTKDGIRWVRENRTE